MFDNLRSVQYDPLSPAGCNHDLVLQSRVPGYKVGDWQNLAYRDRQVYDGWDKQACLVPFAGWPPRRAFHRWHEPQFRKILESHSDAVDTVLAELTAGGPMSPKDFEFQEHKPEWRGTWFGPNLTKQVLRALWYTGRVMTHSRRSGQHVYDVTERVAPPQFMSEPIASEHEAAKAIILDRHKGIGILRPTAPYEVWAIWPQYYDRKTILKELTAEGSIVPLEIEGIRAHAHRELLQDLDRRESLRQVKFIAPLDQLVWDRKLVSKLFGFDYLWEVYVPGAKRKWGYYVLPVLFGDTFVARFDVWCREATIEIRAWHWEPGQPVEAEFWDAFEEAWKLFKTYLGAHSTVGAEQVDRRVLSAAQRS